MSQSFSDKVAIVTGSSSGIGEAIAIKFAQQGASVVVCGRNEPRTQAVRKKCVSASKGREEKFIIFLGDLTEKSSRERLVAETVAKFSRLDILVTSAGVVTTNSVYEDTEESFDFVINGNLKTVYFLIQQALPYLENTRGSVVCVSSTLSTLTMANMVVYQMSKAGLDKMVRALALALGPKGIRINAVNSGAVETRLFRDVPDHDEDTRVRQTGEATPLHGKVSTAEDQADIAVFLAGSNAQFVTGECIKVDGANSLA